MADITTMVERIEMARTSGQFDEVTKSSVKWFSKEVKKLSRGVNKPALMNYEEMDKRAKALRGGMFMFRYNPAFKDRLPYWDRFPLVLAVEHYTKPVKGFSGLNLHYLDYYDRAILLEAIMGLGNSAGNRVTRLTYDLLSRSKRFRRYKGCVKRYRYDNVISSMALVPKDLWETVTFLPVEDFRKYKNKRGIWKESKIKWRSNK